MNNEKKVTYIYCVVQTEASKTDVCMSKLVKYELKALMRYKQSTQGIGRDKAADCGPFSCSAGPKRQLPRLFRDDEKGCAPASSSPFQTSALTHIQVFRKLARCSLHKSMERKKHTAQEFTESAASNHTLRHQTDEVLKGQTKYRLVVLKCQDTSWCEDKTKYSTAFRSSTLK